MQTKKCTSYSDKDIKNISMIMTLYNSGFDDVEAEKHLALCFSAEDTAEKRTAMPAAKRKHTLNEIHLKQNSLAALTICDTAFYAKAKNSGVLQKNTK